MIAVIDYGMGNIHSVKKALELFGAKIKVTNNPSEIEASEKIILPGVGAFDDAMLELEKQNLTGVIKEQIKLSKPFLGICLGMQLLFERSQEANKCKGLGVIKGEVKKFNAEKGLKVPHMGWNQVSNINKKCSLLKGIPDDSFVYFCHSYYPEPSDKTFSLAYCDYGFNFPCVVGKGNMFGVQFHPEKSQDIGLKILENFVKLC